MKFQTSLIAGALVALTLGAGSAEAQVLATIKGRVLDEKGKPVTEATITIEVAAVEGAVPGKPIVIKTDKKGIFTQERIMPGTYKVTIEKEGLNKASNPAVTLTRGQNLDIGDVKLQKGAPDQSNVFKKALDLVNAGKYDEAEAAYKEIFTALEPTKDKVPPAEWAKLHFNLGLVYEKKKDWANAEASYRKAGELDPTLVEPYKGLANVYKGQKRWDDGVAAFTQAVAAQPENSYLIYELGIFYREARKYEEAYTQFAKASTLIPDNPEIFYDLGTTAISLNKIPEALKNLEKYVAMNPANQANVDAAKQIIPALKQATSTK